MFCFIISMTVGIQLLCYVFHRATELWKLLWHHVEDRSNHNVHLLRAKCPTDMSEFSVIKNKLQHSHGNLFNHIYRPQSIPLITRNAHLYWRWRKSICSEDSLGPRDISFYLVHVITLNHIKKWFPMHFSKFLIWFLMLRESLIRFLILG